jgi:riboflavin biosynthesis pyrimidine reductase
MSMQVAAILALASETKTATPSRANVSAQMRSARSGGSAIELTSESRKRSSNRPRSGIWASLAVGIWAPVGMSQSTIYLRMNVVRVNCPRGRRPMSANMKPYVICHMNASVDGRILGSRWRPAENRMAGLFERLHEQLGGGSWLIGRVTGSEYAKAEAYPDHTDQTYPREPWFARRDAAYGIALDAQGKIAWGRSEIGGDPIVAVLTERVSDAHLAGLRQDGVSYIFAGEQELDLGLALEILNRELALERLLLEGGGGSNGSFLRAGLIDEISLAICPAVDGAKGAPSIFDSSDADASIAAPICSMTLASCEVLEGGAVWLRYRLQNL